MHHRTHVIAGERVVLCAACAAELEARPCETCGPAAGGPCAKCGQVADLTRERVRVPHPAAIAVRDEGTFA